MARGRPKKEIDKTAFEKLCGLHCTKSEICAFFDVTDKTLDKWCRRTYKENFSVVFKQKQDYGKISLRRSQWRMAETNPTMAIWLGKNLLGQSDHPVQEVHENELLQSLNALLRGENDG